MKNTFSAYVRLSQTRTRESMQAAFRVCGQGEAGPCPGRVVGGSPNSPLRRGSFQSGGGGAIIRLSGGHACNTRVTEFPIMKLRRPGHSCTRKTNVISWSHPRARRGREVTSTAGGAAQLLAISDLHIGYPENRSLVERMRPDTD